MIYDNLTQLIGNTPMLRLKRIEEKYEAQAQIVAKIESFNPGGSAKDRIALQMIEDAEEQGKLKPGGVIIEPTSGNTGVGLAWISQLKGYKAIIVMPDTMSQERQSLMRAMGATLVLTPGKQGMNGAIQEAEKLCSQTPNSIILGQFTNPANVQAHLLTTGKEIWEDMDGQVDVLVAGVGTGGTLSGTAQYLKGKNPYLHVVAVEPSSSAVLSGNSAGLHKLQGIGAGFIPQILDTSIIDEVLTISNEDAYTHTRQLSASEGLLVGISSGAAVCAAIQLAQRSEYKGKKIVVILPDTGERYLSTPELF